MKSKPPSSINITFGICGSIEAAIVPYHIARLRGSHPHINVHCVTTNGAMQFVTEIALRGISGCEVCTNDSKFCRDGVPMHIANAARDLMVIYPATARVISEMALGIISCPITRAFAFCDKSKIIITPYFHPSMDLSLYTQHISVLKNIGCRVIEPNNELTWNKESAWVATGFAIRSFLGLDTGVETTTTLKVASTAQFHRD
jgi:phosphopantothenoylcysteine decarboxylase/phosphopantothenate--cysteine ligase